MGTQAAIGGSTAWVSDIDKGACKILAHRFPGVPNIGDMTAVKWTPDCPTCGTELRAVNLTPGEDGYIYWCPACKGEFSTSIRPPGMPEPVDVMTGGTPCQDLSHAGKRAGMTEGTRSNLWVAMREAIAQLRPGLVIWENVRGAYSAEADSDLVNDPRLLADTRRRDGEPILRALGRVLGDLSELGYVGGWHGLRAADIGAPHGRFRVFVIAYLPDPERGGCDGWASLARRRSLGGVAAQGSGEGTLLPTPAVNDMGAAYTPQEWDAWTERMKAQHGNGNGHGKSLNIEAQRLLRTPQAVEGRKAVTGQGSEERLAGGHQPFLTNQVADYVAAGQDWGEYAASIHRWEKETRPAPPPTEIGPKGQPRLAAAFSEWLMGLPAGWVTDVPEITRNETLKALGNGVVPQQAEAAVRFLLHHLCFRGHARVGMPIL